MSRHRYVQQTLVVDYNRPALGGNCQLLDRLRVFVMYLPNEVIYLFPLILFWPAFVSSLILTGFFPDYSFSI